MNKLSAALPRVTFDQLVINTGRSHPHEAINLSKQACSSLRPLLPPGVHRFRLSMVDDDLRLFVSHIDPGHVAFTICRVTSPLLSCHCCTVPTAAERVWSQAIESHRETAQWLLKAQVPDDVRVKCAAMPFVTRPKGLFQTVHLRPGFFEHQKLCERISHLPWGLYYCFWLEAQRHARAGV